MAEAYGNVVQHWQAYINAYVLSQDNTAAWVRCECYHHSIGWGYNVRGDGEAKVAGDSGGRVAANFYAASGQTRNQKITYRDVYIYKGHSGQNVWCEGIVRTTGGYHNGTSSAGVNVWVDAKPSYTVSYNSNGGSGSPGNQTKWYDENLTLSSTRPTRTGYTFQGWSTSNDSSVEYQPGQNYGGNSNLTLYAVWKVNTWTVSYNSNGGSGSPGNQTKVYGQTLTLSSTRPTRNLYNFMGWGTSSGSTTPSYQPGGAYTNNASITLYAIWELAWVAPRITNLQATRCTSDGTLNDEGTYAKVSFNWETDRTVSKIAIVCNGVTVNGSGSGTSGSVSLVLGNNALSTEKEYPITVTITDAVGRGSMSTTVAPMNYLIDFKGDGSGVAIGKPATLDHIFEIDYPTRMNRNVTVGGTMTANAATVNGALNAGSAAVTNDLTAQTINIGDILSIQNKPVTDVIIYEGQVTTTNPYGNIQKWNVTKYKSGRVTLVGWYDKKYKPNIVKAYGSLYFEEGNVVFPITYRYYNVWLTCNGNTGLLSASYKGGNTSGFQFYMSNSMKLDSDSVNLMIYVDGVE